MVFFRLRNEGIYSFFQNRQNLTFWLLRNLSTAVCAGAWANCDYIPENYPRLHRGLFCAALTMYAGASSHSHFTFPAAVEGSSLRGGESIGKCGNSVMSNCILPVQIRQFRPLQVPKSSTCLLSYDWLAPQSRPASRNNNNNNNFICAHTKI